MPGTIPATSQLDRLISMTAINVLAGSRAMRDRLKSFNVCMGSSIGSQRTMDTISTPPPHSIFHHGIRRRGGTIFWATLPSMCQADMRTHRLLRCINVAIGTKRTSQDVGPFVGAFARGVCGARARADQSEDQRRSRGSQSALLIAKSTRNMQKPLLSSSRSTAGRRRSGAVALDMLVEPGAARQGL